jgi:hypothetical protein
VEVSDDVSIGSFVAFQDQVATVRAQTGDDAQGMVRAVAASLTLARQRELDSDAADGIKQLEAIGWTSMSSAKQDPAPGRLTILQLRDLLAR